MATKSIVPRASGEGQLGSSLKIWKEIHQLTSSFGTANFKENENNILTLNNSPLIVSSGLSGSLTQLADGSSYLVEGAGVSITSGSTGQVTITSTGLNSFTLAGSTGSSQTIEDGNTLTIAAGTNITTTAGATDTVTIALSDSPTIGGNLTVTGDLTINGTTTTIDTQNLLVEDPMVLLASGTSSSNQNGGLAILSGSSVSDESLVIGRVDTDMWGVGRLDVQSGAVTDLSGMTSVSFKAADLISTTGVISGSSNKAIEFDSLGNILTLTTGSVVEHNVLAYDGTKWVASASLGSETSGVDTDAVASMFVSGSHTNISFEHDEVNDVLNATVSVDDAITVTYAPSPVYAKMYLATTVTSGLTSGAYNVVPFDAELADTSPNSDMVDLANNRFKVPSGVTKVSIKATANIQNTANYRVFSFIKHYRGGVAITDPVSSFTLQDYDGSAEFPMAHTGIIDVQQGDEFEYVIYSDSFTGYSIVGTNTDTITRTWMEMEVVEGSILNTTVNSTISDFTADTLTLSEGVISGSSNKAIEFDSLGNILTLTTGSAVQHNVLAYDGTKWIASASLGSGFQPHDADLDTLSGMQTGAAGALALLTQTELEILDGATLSTTELNYVDGVTSNIQTQLDSKAASTTTLQNVYDNQISSNEVTLDTAGETFKISGSGSSQIVFGSSNASISNNSVGLFALSNDVVIQASDKVEIQGSGGGFLSGSSTGGDKALEWDQYGNITTIGTGSASTNDFLKYDGTKWVPETTDAMTITYAPSVVYGRLNLATADSIGVATEKVDFDARDVDSTSGNILTDPANGRLLVPAGVDKVIIKGALYSDSNVSGDLVAVIKRYNSSGVEVAELRGGGEINSEVTDRAMVISGIQDVQQGDYFELWMANAGASGTRNLPVNADLNWFEMQVVEGSILNTTVATTLPNAMSITYQPNPVYARMTQSSNQSMTTNQHNTVQYDTVAVDTSPSSNLTSTSDYRFVIPAGISKVKLRASLSFGTSTNVDTHENNLAINKNGSSIASTAMQDDGPSTNTVSAFTGIINVVQGDYFQVTSWGGGQSNSTSASSSSTWFEIEVVEGSILNTTVASTISNTMTVTYAPTNIYATIYRTSAYTVPTGGPVYTTAPWDATYKDTFPSGGVVDTTNNRLVVPAGVTKVKLSANLQGGNTTAEPGRFEVIMRHHDSSNNILNTPIGRDTNENTSWEYINLQTAIVDVSQGDYFDIGVWDEVGFTSATPTDPRYNWFTMEVVEGSVLNTTVNSTITDLTVGGDLSVTGGELSAPTTGVAATGTDTLGADEYIYLANDNTTLTLPTPESGRKYLIKLAGTYSSGVTINTNNTSTVKIDGNGTQTLGSSHAFIEIVSDGSNWFIIGKDGTVTGSN